MKIIIEKVDTRSIPETVVVEGLVVEAVKVHKADVITWVDRNDISRKTALSQLNMILVLLQVAVVEFGILCLNIVVSLV